MTKVNPIDLQRALKGVGYPADRHQLVDTARRNGAESHLVETLTGLQRDRFDGPDEVEQAVFRAGS